MLIKNCLSLLLFSVSLSALTQKVPLTYYLPDIDYDESITTPEEFLGHQVGEWHVSHDRLYYYMKQLASESERIVLNQIGKTHEDRPLINLIITSPRNHRQLDQIKETHKALTFVDQSSAVNIDDLPVVIYQGYSIHGNEASGSNAALMNAYYLASGLSDHVLELLDNSVIILDPSFNPDGLHRFSTWANSHKNKNITADPNHREYREPWPRGRTNHYWFDLNRDWLLLTHPESRARIKVFHEWKPDILTDHHEMGTNSTFFFQPGIPSRTNPNTPNQNQNLTFEIGKFHARALDKIGSLYYTKESFDDYYYGKGSTYPDVNGGIGILFEQASSRGHAQESAHGLLTFPFAIRNQVVTSLSTQEAGLALRKDLLEYKRKFFQDARSEAKRFPVKAYVFGNSIDPFRTNRFIEILRGHEIEVYHLAKDTRATNRQFNASESFVVPTNQLQFKLIKSIFEKVNTFRDSLFYDVSAWTLPLAFDLNYGELRGNIQSHIGSSVKPVNATTYTEISEVPYAFLVDWSDYLAPSVLNELLRKELVIRVSHRDFTVNINGHNMQFRKGTLIVPADNQPVTLEELNDLLRDLGSKYFVNITEVPTGLTSGGFSLGSPSMSALKKSDVAILVGEGVSGYDSGETWHHCDQVLQISVPLLDITRFGNLNIDRYNTIVMVDGNYRAMESQVEKLKAWISDGGNVIASRRAINWLKSKEILKIEKVDMPKDEKAKQSEYGNRRNERGARVTGGAIVQMNIDLTHPLFYGYDDPYLATFKKGNDFYQPLDDAYSTPGRYTSSPLLSGYMHTENLSKLPNSAGVFVAKSGRGRIIGIVDNPHFRGYWWGCSKLFANAVFFGHILN